MTTTEHLTADEFRTCVDGLLAWQDEFGVTGDDWSDVDALVDKLHRMAAALDPPTEEHQ